VPVLDQNTYATGEASPCGAAGEFSSEAHRLHDTRELQDASECGVPQYAQAAEHGTVEVLGKAARNTKCVPGDGLAGLAEHMTRRARSECACRGR